MDGSSKIDIKFESTTFSFRAFLSPIMNQYNNFIYTVVAFTIAFGLSVWCFSTNKSVYNLSEWMIVQIAAFVVSTSIVLLAQTVNTLDTNLKYVGLCALVNIALSLFFLRKYESVVFIQFNNRNKMIKLAIFLAIYFALVIFWQKNLVFWIYQGFVLLAMQINYSYSVGGKGGMDISLVLTIVFTRVPFIYFRYYLQSLSRQPNNPKMLIIFIGVHTILLSFITMQRYLGSRFIIPN